MRLRPAYYSAWIFDGTLEVPWSCQVKEGSGTSERWVPRNGLETRFFSDILVPGVRSLKKKEFTSIEPFNLADIEEFAPEYLAGWPTLVYDRSLSDASLLARERVKSSELFLQAGRAQVRDVLDAQEALVSAQNALTSALVNYRIAELRLQRDMGVLEIDHRGLWSEYTPANTE